MAVKWRIAPTVGSLAHYSPFSLMQQVCFRPLFLCLPKESRQDNCPLLRQKSGKSNKKSTVVWYFYSPIQGVSLFHHSLTFHGIVLRAREARTPDSAVAPGDLAVVRLSNRPPQNALITSADRLNTIQRKVRLWRKSETPWIGLWKYQTTVEVLLDFRDFSLSRGQLSCRLSFGKQRKSGRKQTCCNRKKSEE